MCSDSNRKTVPSVRSSKGSVLVRVAAALIVATPFATCAADATSGLAKGQAVPAPPRTLPVVISQPQSVVVISGQPATFSVDASSATALTYQWMLGADKIGGATGSAYVVPTTAMTDSGARYTVIVKNLAGAVTSATARLTVNASVSIAATSARPYGDQSPWNSRPTQFTLGTFVVPTSSYYPSIEEGTWSTGAFVASVSDPSVTVKGPSDGVDLWIPDAEQTNAQIIVPHWPAGVVPATGADGHADIIDPATNRIHSFYQLRQVDGQWRASSYTWTALDGRGFGTPAQYQQGSRAAGVPASAGLIRSAEVNDGLPVYHHALAMSMTYNALSRNPTYTFPATNADGNAQTTNAGVIPEGALVMLPASFDLSQIANPKLLKVARTLQSFGAYVVDRNDGTPFEIYVENGANFGLYPNGFDTAIAGQLDTIRAALRQVVSTTQSVDATGAIFTPEHRLNLLSMRGYWYMTQGTAPGVFDTLQQAVVFPASGVQTTQISTGRNMPAVFGAPVAGQPYTLVVKATGKATMKVDLLANGYVVYTTGVLADGATVTFNWPAVVVVANVWTYSAVTGGGTVGGTLTAVNP